jgi:hypothetical protein
VLDDMQWYANETLEWLSFLVRFESRARLLIIGCLRSDEIDAGHPVAQLLLDLRGADLLTELALAPLSAEETYALADQLADHTFDAAAGRALYRFTEGNPLFVVETVRANLDAALLAQPVESPAQGLPLPILPPRVQSVIQTRLAQLSVAAHELAALAATIGRSFTFDVLAQAYGQSEDVVVRSLDELWQRRVVREQGANMYDFSHDRIRDVAYAEISPARRRSLHRRVASSLIVIVGVITLTFVLTRVLPSDPAQLIAGQRARPEQVAAIRSQLGLDRPLPEQFARYLGGLAHGDLGRSFVTKRRVAEDLGIFLPASWRVPTSGARSTGPASSTCWPAAAIPPTPTPLPWRPPRARTGSPPHLMNMVPGGFDTKYFTTDHMSGYPYIMWAGTDLEHIMIPVADMPME